MNLWLQSMVTIHIGSMVISIYDFIIRTLDLWLHPVMISMLAYWIYGYIHLWFQCSFSVVVNLKGPAKFTHSNGNLQYFIL